MNHETDWRRLAEAELTHDKTLAHDEAARIGLLMAEKLILVRQGAGTFTEPDASVIWVMDSYTEPRETLFDCTVCDEPIEDWNLFTCLDGGDAAHTSCVTVVEPVPLNVDPSPAKPGPDWTWPDDHGR